MILQPEHQDHLGRDSRIEYDGQSGYPKHPAPPADSPLYGIWCREWCKAIYGNWTGNFRDGDRYGDRQRRYQNNRNLARSDQDVTQYRELFPETEGEGGETGNWVNIDWTPLKMPTVLMNRAHSLIANRPYKPTATAIDPTSQSEKRKHLNKQIARIKAEPFIQKMNESTGRNMLPFKEGAPKTMDEHKIYEGNYKHDAEVDIETLIDLTFDANDVGEIRDKIIRDLMECGPGAAIEYVDQSGCVKIKRFKPEDLVISYSDRDDFKDIWYGGGFEYYDESSFRQLAGKAFTEDEYAEIMELKGLGQGSDTWEQTWGNTNSSTNKTDHKVQVLYMTWASWVPKKAIRNKETGEVREVPEDYTPKNESQAEEMIQKNFKVWHEARWVVGSRFVFRFQMMNDIKRDEKNLGECDAPVKCYMPNQNRMACIPLIEHMEPHIHQMNLAWYKLQNFLAGFRPGELAIDLAMLASTGHGEGGVEGTEAITRLNQTGIYFYNSIDPETGIPMNYPPMHNLNIDATHKFVALWNVFDRNVGLLRESIGMDAATAGQPTPGDVVVAEMQQQVIGTDHALFNYARAVDNIIERLAEGCIGRYQVISKHRKNEGVIEAIGLGKWKRIEINSDISMRVFGLKIDITFNGQLREQLMNWINLALQENAASQGARGITLPEAVEIARTMDSNIKMAMQMLTYKIEKREKEQKEMEQAKMDNELQKVAESQKQNAEASLAQIEAKKQADLEVIRIKEQEARVTAAEAHKHRLVEIKASGEIDRSKEFDKGDIKIDEQRLKGEQKKEEIKLQNEGQKEIARLKEQKKTVNS